jgi:hypothetical protein
MGRGYRKIAFGRSRARSRALWGCFCHLLPSPGSNRRKCEAFFEKPFTGLAAVLTELVGARMAEVSSHGKTCRP